MSESKHAPEAHETGDPTVDSGAVTDVEGGQRADAVTGESAGFAVSSDGVTDSAATDRTVSETATPADSETVVTEREVVDATPVDTTTDEPAPTEAERRAAAIAAAAMADDDDTPWYDRPEVAAAEDSLPDVARETPTTVTATETDAATVKSPVVADEPATAPLAPPVAPAATPSESAAPTVIGSGQSTVFVQAPEEPVRRGNRGFAGLVGLLATIVFAVVYLAALLLAKGAESFASVDALGTAAVGQLTGFEFWTPVVAFFLGFWLLGAFINTAKWGYWVVFGILVGLAALLGHVVGTIFAQPRGFFSFDLQGGLQFAWEQIFTLPGVIAFVIGRELPIWFGGWIARRGRKVVAANAEAQEEYERTIEAGPQLVEQ